MPVLVTIAAVSYLFGGSKEKASFLNPAGLRKKVEKWNFIRRSGLFDGHIFFLKAVI